MLKGAPNVQEAVKVFTVDDNFNIDNLVEYLSKFNAQSDPAVLYTRIEAIDLSAQKDQIPMGESFAFESFANSLKIYDYIYMTKDGLFLMIMISLSFQIISY